MKLIVGLGNPGAEYQATRHNIGFMVIDELVRRWGLAGYKQKFDAHYYEYRYKAQAVMLAKPQTYMNLSGVSVAAISRFYKLEIKDIVVIYDDMDLPLGSLRIRPKGSAGGHRGMKSMIQHLGSEDFTRIRLGIGRPCGEQEVVDFVLHTFSQHELSLAQEVIVQAADAVECFLDAGTDQAMNQYNRT